MFRLLIDTSVWLDLAKDYREQPVIGALEDLVAAGEIELIVPQIVVDEFNRNKARVIDEARRSLQSHFRLVREAVNRFGTDDYRADTLKALNEVDHKIVTGNEAVIEAVGAKAYRRNQRHDQATRHGPRYCGPCALPPF
jgi:predicted nucleic acid-binding protein